MSIYTKAKLGASDNYILLNDTSSDPYYRVKARAPSKWQIRQQDLPVPFESGSSDFLTLIGTSAYIISGIMYPSNESKYDEGLNSLRTVSSLDIEQADPNSDIGYVPYTWGDALGNYTKQIFVKPLFCQLAETTTQGYVQPFTIYCKVKDPTIFGGTTKSISTQQSNVTQTIGSATFSVTFPVIFGATLMAVSSTAVNSGSLASYPASIIVHGPINIPQVTNNATGEFIKINCNLVSSIDILTITYDKDTLDINLNGDSQIQNLTTDSTLFKIQPGINVISLTGSTISTSAYAEVNYYDAWPLS